MTGGDRLARKKEKLKVNLELPKNDTTMTKLYLILGLGMILGISSIGFWFINSPFLPTPNGQPMFINIACGWDPTFQPDLDSNESCDLMHDEPQVSVFEAPQPWKKVLAEGQRFTAPGLLPEERGNYSGQLTQAFELKCEAKADVELPYTLELWDSEKNVIASKQDGITNRGGCSLQHDHVEPGEEYSYVLYSNDPGGEKIREFTFSLHIEVYDGVPEYMNNKSLWLGPELDLGITSFRPTLFLNFFGLGIFIAFFPASYYWDGVKNRINSMEDKFPDFLRDMAEYWKGGLSMNVAVQTLASSEYGALNDEVKKMADQLSWGVAFGDVMQLFADRVGTPLVKRAISLIQEANKAGGKISDILVTAANDSREIKFLEGERKRAIASYIAVIWVSYMVFLGVIVVLGKVFIPAIASSNSGDDEGGEGDDGSAKLGNMEIRAIDPLFFLMVFYYGVTLQAVGNGCMAGLMATGRLSSGMKHAGMMIVLASLAFNFVVFAPELIGIQPPEEIDVRAGTFEPTMSIQNTAPIATNLMLLPATPTNSDDLEVSYAYYDEDNHPEEGTEIRWYRNGNEVIVWSELTTIPASETQVGDSIYYIIRPSDGIELGSYTSLLDDQGAVTVVA